MNISRRVGEKS